MDKIEQCLAGQTLYGDDFTPEEIAAWYEAEQEGYAELGAKDQSSYHYQYHAWNRFHAYRHLPERRFARTLGFGSAYGDELEPVIDKIDHVTVVDPSLAFVRDDVHGVPATYIQPGPDGALDVEDGSFDLITCLGVLHHIPNVSSVVRELGRVLAPDGWMVLREPIVSMGDWRRPRQGLTKHERGIPPQLLDEMIRKAGLTVKRRSYCAFPVVRELFKGVRNGTYNSPLLTRVDSALSRALAWNHHYHPRNKMQKFRPTAAFFLLNKA